MAKKSAKKVLKKKAPAKAAKKTSSVKVKKGATKAGKVKVAKPVPKKSATKVTAKKPQKKQASVKKPATKFAFKAEHVAVDSHTKNGVKPVDVHAAAPAAQSRTTAHPVAATPAIAAPDAPESAYSTLTAPTSPASHVSMSPEAATADRLPPGKRVRHRYEHWWGTVVGKTENSSDPMAAPGHVRYVVNVDGGMHRDDIRPEDLTT